MSVRSFLDQQFRHFNARTTVEAARGWEKHAQGGGKMLVSLAGAMSTAEMGGILARMIRADLVHAISCTGANLEEDVFNLVAGKDYEIIPNWRALRAEDDKALYDRGMNRVTDICIPETVMRHIEKRLVARWVAASQAGISKRPSEHLMDVLDDETLLPHLQRDPSESWLWAAKEKGIPVYTPGWEDSTTGNIFAGHVFKGTLPNHHPVQHGTAQMEHLMRWYIEQSAPVGFFQIGGGIAGDFAICAVPCLIQDLEMEDTPFWAYFCQISDAVTSYGGYSGAPPNEKITWGKLDTDTPKYMIESDATIVAPLIFAYLLND
ncbi:MAG: deoxyhypusine synthase family protein [Myxococcota bacterium]